MQRTLSQRVNQLIREVNDFPKEGIVFKDIMPIFHHPKVVDEIIEQKYQLYNNKVDVVVGIESRGFLIGFPLALKLNVPFVMVRKKGKLPPPVISESYQLEYGSSILEIQNNALLACKKVLIHDDILATGGTALATINLVKKLEGQVAGIDFLMELSFLKGRELFPKIKVESLINL